MQKLNADLGYLKYTDFLSADRIFTFTYRARALQELGPVEPLKGGASVRHPPCSAHAEDRA